MNAMPQGLSVESIEGVLVEKEAVLVKEQAMLEDLRRLLDRMGYEIVPAGPGKRRRGERSRALGAHNASPAPATVPEGRKRGRPRKAVAPLGGETATE